jgi:disabled family protein 2
MTDSRAFGYIFGSPDCGHRFFGIKTDKAASQVVLAMRDLFQCVFELKKKEIEMAKQHIQNRITAHEHQQIKSSILEHKKNVNLLNEASPLTATTTTTTSMAKLTAKQDKSPEATANLVDLEQELSSIQRGITQMERMTPNDDVPVSKNVLDDDPFGDSFTSFSSSTTTTPFNILPPPSATTKRMIRQTEDDSLPDLSLISNQPSLSITPTNLQSHHQQQPSSLDSWLTKSTTFSETDIVAIDDGSILKSNSRSIEYDDDSNVAYLNTTKTELIGAFTDLDPLGKKTYVDKKYFFQDLKNPPKKVLRDLSEQESIFDAHFSQLKQNLSTGEAQEQNSDSLTMALTSRLKDGTSSPKVTHSSDPFEEEDFSKIMMMDEEAVHSQKSIILPDTKINSVPDNKPKNHETQVPRVFNMDLNVADSFSTTTTYSDLKRQGSDSSSKNVFSVDSFSKKLPKPPNLFGQRNVKREANGINMRRLQESDSLSENEPELPPRIPDSEPPPLPPKNLKEMSGELQIDRNRYVKVSRDSGSRYEYTNKFKSLPSDSPPIPLPSRKINRKDSTTNNATSLRGSKKADEDNVDDENDYLTPSLTHGIDSFPQLPPPPPPQKNTLKMRGPRKSDTDPKNLDAPTPPISAKTNSTAAEISFHSSSILPNITLSQLLTLGIDDLAHKLKVPASKLSTMTIVELTTYLSEFIESSKQMRDASTTKAPSILTRPSIATPNDSPVFKVSFDDAVFEAKFDDNFGEINQITQDESTFIANFENFNQAPVSVIPTADRYAVFREIIDQEIQQQQSFEEQHQESIDSNSLEDTADFDHAFIDEPPVGNILTQSSTPIAQTSKVDGGNKIIEALSSVKDRYAALRELRNIVLVEDLFDKKNHSKPSISDSNLSDEFHDNTHQDAVFPSAEAADTNSLDNLATYSVSWPNDELTSESIENPTVDHDEEQSLEQKELERNKEELSNGRGTPLAPQAFAATSNKDDLEIDEFMKKAISELSLDQRISPNIQSKTSPKSIDGEFSSVAHVSLHQADENKKSPSNYDNKPSTNFRSLSIASTDHKKMSSPKPRFEEEIREVNREKKTSDGDIHQNYDTRGRALI